MVTMALAYVSDLGRVFGFEVVGICLGIVSIMAGIASFIALFI